ncbi:MAG: hypothetical protein CFH27_00753 [Alphaproteobacteria bacterium MarineAlpha6_Bin5]|nr:MAG: hypothetical protein CFH27_00753 [Alphaproteobacteria bacterium MarineAlpha6_Bin5]|tara:strand:+ start:19091 stop:21007 length:1917 start_codon:yes stop_codon:yes gene_type:complete
MMLKKILNRENKLPIIVILAIISFFSFNVLNKNFFKNLRFDLTSSNVYTLSPGTGAILKSIKEPLDFKLFYTKEIGDVNPVYQNYYDRVKEILEQYVLLSNNKIRLKIFNPKPFSNEEDKAVEYGLQGAEIMAGVYGYFGLIATNSTDDEEKIIFFQPDRSSFLEYDLSKIVTNLANPNRRVVGVYSDLPIFGTFNPLAKTQDAAAAPPWAVYNQMKEFFEVKRIHEKTSSIPEGLELLMLIHPKKIPEKLLYLIDQFVLNGGKLFVLVDPNSETEAFTPDANPASQTNNSSDLKVLLENWGIDLVENKVVGDLLSARRVEIGSSDQPSVTDYIAWLDIKKDHMDDKHQVTSKIQRLTFATAGYLKNNEKNKEIDFKRLVWSTTQSMKIDASDVKLNPDPTNLLRNFVPSNEELTLVAEIKGKFSSNFPDGPPDTGREDDFKDIKHTNESIKPTTLVVSSDADMLYDEYWLKYEQSGDVTPIANNADFVVNFLEYLNGTEDLIGLRGKGMSSNPFIKVEKIQKEAEQKFRSKEQELLEKLNNYQSKLENIQEGSNEEKSLLTENEILEIEKFKEEMILVRSELRKVQNALRKDIEKLDSILKFFNIFFVPILLIIISLILSLVERRKRHKKHIIRETN